MRSTRATPFARRAGHKRQAPDSPLGAVPSATRARMRGGAAVRPWNVPTTRRRSGGRRRFRVGARRSGSLLAASIVALTLAGCGTGVRTNPSAAGAPVTVSPSVSSSPTAVSSAPIAKAPPAASRVAGSFDVTDRNGYAYRAVFDVGITSNVGEDTANAKPGQANVAWTGLLVDGGAFALTNTTAGHNLPVPAWAVSSCQATYHCLSLHGFFPRSSPVCTTKTSDPSGHYAYLEFAPSVGDNLKGLPPLYISPPGEWCVLNYGIVAGLSKTELAAGGSMGSTWQASGTTSVVLLDEKQYPVLAAALTAGPSVWSLDAPTSKGETTSYSLSNCVAAATTVFWSSKPLTCMR